MFTPLAITGRGMVSSLGNDVVTNCAAARAGIIRAEKLDWFPIPSPDDGSPEGVIGYPATLWTLGFEGHSRLLRLLQGALTDLQRQTPHAPWEEGRTAFYLSLPDPKRLSTGLNLIPNEDDRKAREEEAREAAGEAPEYHAITHLFQKALSLSCWPGTCVIRCIKTSGHTGIAECLSDAIHDLSADQVDFAIVGGADSLLDEDSLTWLSSLGRLKTAESPAGLAPGEAGAFVVLESMRGATARAAKVCGVLRDLRIAEDTTSLFSAKPPLGSGVSGVVSGLAQNTEWQEGGPIWFIVDQNGEEYRAAEWGQAIVRLAALSHMFTQSLLWYPADSFGDTGAATGAVALCVAASAFSRGYAPARTVGIVFSADHGQRAGILLQLPEGRRN